MTKITTPDPMDAIAAQAASLDEVPPDGAAQPGEGETAAPGLTNEQAFGGAIAAGREAFCFFTKLESPRRVLDDEAVQQLAQVWAPVLDKHGINVGAYLGDYGLEITAAICTLTIAAKLRTAVTVEILSKKVDEEAIARYGSAEPAQEDAQPLEPADYAA